MKLHSIEFKLKKPRRVGRGGKRGTTSGRGQKGQKSRAGRVIRPAIRDIILRIPKKRGFRNKPVSNQTFEVGAQQIAAKAAFLSGKEKHLTIAALKEVRLVPARFQGTVKIISKGSNLPKMDFVLGPGIKASKSVSALFQNVAPSKTAAKKVAK